MWFSSLGRGEGLDSTLLKVFFNLNICHALDSCAACCMCAVSWQMPLYPKILLDAPWALLPCHPLCFISLEEEDISWTTIIKIYQVQ